MAKYRQSVGLHAVLRSSLETSSHNPKTRLEVAVFQLVYEVRLRTQNLGSQNHHNLSVTSIFLCFCQIRVTAGRCEEF